MLPINGNVILRMPHPHDLLSIGMGTEMIYSLVIILCSLGIYFGTKELYSLSSHKGIKYFREAFLLFAIAYFFRSFIKFIVLYFNMSIFNFRPTGLGFLIGPISLFVFIYLSSMAIFYLFYSVSFEKYKKRNMMIFFNVFSFALALYVLVGGTQWSYLLVNVVLFLIALKTLDIAYKNQGKKNKNSLYFVYFLLPLFLTFNIIDVLVPDFFQTMQFFVYVASIIIFMAIEYSVLKRAGA